MKSVFKVFMPFILFFSLANYSSAASKSNSLIVVGDNVNLRQEPSPNSPIVFKLYLTKTVRVVKRTDKKITIDNKSGEWVYVDTGSFKKDSLDETIKGWVFDYYLADLNVFEKINSYKNCSIEGVVGDYLLSYEFYKDGTYKRKLFEYEKNTNRFIKGKLYRYRDVVAAVDEDGRQELFYFRKDGSLCCQQFHEDGAQMCATCK
jgi:hypothetical protein